MPLWTSLSEDPSVDLWPACTQWNPMFRHAQDSVIWFWAVSNSNLLTDKSGPTMRQSDMAWFREDGMSGGFYLPFKAPGLLCLSPACHKLHWSTPCTLKWETDKLPSYHGPHEEQDFGFYLQGLLHMKELLYTVPGNKTSVLISVLQLQLYKIIWAQ